VGSPQLAVGILSEVRYGITLNSELGTRNPEPGTLGEILWIKKKQACKPDSVHFYFSWDGLLKCKNALSFIWTSGYPECSIRLPFNSDVQPSDADVFGVSPHRVYLISLQPYLYLLSVALVLPHICGVTGVTRYVALWCPDFPPRSQDRSDKEACQM